MEKIKNNNSLENTHANEALKLEQDKFMHMAEKVAHDINSPLSALKMLAEMAADMPEDYRHILRQANDRIQGIVSDLLREYKKHGSAANDMVNVQPTLVSALLLDMLYEKKSQYTKLPIEFNHDFSLHGNFSFIMINPAAYARAISSIINNAVDVVKGKENARIILHLDATINEVIVTILDNGTGMSPLVVNNLLNNIAATDDKKNGRGMGYAQIHDILADSGGRLFIDSQVGVGTSITIAFPRIKSPKWITDEIILHNKDTVIILDDEPSIHDAWDTRFFHTFSEEDNISVHHFTHGQYVLDFIGQLNSERKQKLYLLCDYELLKQDLQGLEIIKKSGVKRHALITSHYLNEKIRNDSMELGTKILPKQLAPHVTITVHKAEFGPNTNS